MFDGSESRSDRLFQQGLTIGAGQHAHAHHAGHHLNHFRGIVIVAIHVHFFFFFFFLFAASFTPMLPGGDTAVYRGFGSQNVVTVTHRRRHVARGSRWERGVARMKRAVSPMPGQHQTPPSAATDDAGQFGASNVVAEARRYIGGNPTGRSSLWCARFMNMVLQRSGHRGTDRTWRVRSRAMASASPVRRSAPSR